MPTASERIRALREAGNKITGTEIPGVVVKLSGANVIGIEIENHEGIRVEVRQYHVEYQEGCDDPDGTREFEWDADMDGAYYEVIA